jgi:LysR family transcriptional regulator, transcriptional activator of nhaA
MVPLNYNQLYYFYKIAQLGSISQASKSILISSPALSMQLKELEETLGTTLFLREGKKMLLTEAGAIVYEYAQDIFKLGFELRDTIGDRGGARERLRVEIGCQDSVPKQVVDELVAFLIQEKGCKIVLREGNSAKLLELQSEYKLDVILTNSLPPVDNTLIYESRLLSREEMGIYGHPKYRALKSKLISGQTPVPFILPTYESSVRHKLENFFKEQNLQPDIIAEVEDKASEVNLALRGFGLMAATRFSVEHLLKSKQLIRIAPASGLHEEIWMILGKRKILNPLALFAMKNFKLP